jgi:histidine phosphotransfer protein HptB
VGRHLTTPKRSVGASLKIPAVETVMGEISVIDPQSIENLRALNPDDEDEFLREIAGIFFEDTPQRIAELDQSLASGDLSKFTRAAHSIKGSSSNLGAMALRAAAEKLEQHAVTHGLADVAALLAGVKAEFGRAQAELTALIAK